MKYDTLIIGGSSGIGLASAYRLKANNLNVLIASKNAKAKTQLSDDGFGLINLDLTKSTDIENALKENQAIKHIIITAIYPLLFDSLDQLEVKDAKAAFNKFWDYMIVIKYAIRQLKAIESFTLVTGSIAYKNLANILSPKITNLAINEAVKTLAIELSPIRINAVSPGPTDTSFYDQISDKESLFDSMKQSVPLKRIAKSDEIAQAIVLATLNSNITGSIINVDGGAYL
ncbi:MAG: SDR family oxidoreductase [Gammaproteobacteria bacterium]|nr:MAG: SDR family oxidoreductase [Gammaproteobacteria bacterium]UTW42949.1 SDR family oxidoreductase [bacterium SCSIO 12844]